MKQWLLVLVALLCFSETWAADESTQKDYTLKDYNKKDYVDRKSANVDVKLSRDSYEMAKHWGLTKKEWTEYLQIKKGPRGFWTPDLDPLTTLGVTETDPVKQIHYAQLFAKLEKERVERETNFQRIYTREFKRLFPNLPMMVSSLVPKMLQMRREQRYMFMKGDRAMVFLNSTCERCEGVYASMLEKIKTIPGFGVDIYFVGDVTDAQIQNWAHKMHVPKQYQDDGSITINYDEGLLSQLLKTPIATVPQVIRSRSVGEEMRYELVDIDTLGVF